MNMLSHMANRLTWPFFVDWVAAHWDIIMIVLVSLIYWAGRQRRLNRHHL